MGPAEGESFGVGEGFDVGDVFELLFDVFVFVVDAVDGADVEEWDGE